MSMVSFPEHWKMAHFGKIATFSKKPRDLQYSEFNEIPFVPMDLIPIAKLFSAKFTLKKNGEIGSGTYFEPGDILLAKITPSFENGKQCIIEELPTPFGIATTEVIPIRGVKSVSDRLYIFYYLLLPDVRTLLAGRMQGTTGRQRLGKETLANLEIPLPPIPEQRAIAQVLRTIQEAKSARQKEIALERERKAALMDYLFSHGTKNEPRKQTEIGAIPESWEVARLGDSVKLKSGLSRPTDMESNPNSELTVPVYGGNGIMGYTSEAFSEQRLLVIGRVGAYCGCVHIAEAPNWITDNALYSEEWFNSEVSLDFLAEQLKHFNLNRLQRKGGQPLITQSIIHGLKIPFPAFLEQCAIAEILISCDTKIAALEQEGTRLDELFHAMLDELMTGKRSAVPMIDAELP